MSQEKGLVEEYKRANKAKENTSVGSKRMNEMLITAQGSRKNYEQVMLKVTSFGSATRGVGAHIRYITRADNKVKEQVPLKDSDGLELKNAEDIKDLLEEWKSDFSRKKYSEREKVKIQLDFKSISEKEKHFDDVKKWAKSELDSYARAYDGKGKTGEKRIYITYEPAGHIEVEIKVAEEKLKNSFPKLDSTVTQLNERRERDTVHFMLSPQSGAKKSKVESIGVAFAEKEFKENGHDFVYAVHNDTKNPHMHLVVKMRSETGKRLEVKKNDLHQWRIKYAEIAREHGLNVEASYRSERGVGTKGDKLSIRKIVDDGRISWVKKSQKEELETGWKRSRGTSEIDKNEPWEIANLKKNKATREQYNQAANQLREKSKGDSLSGEEKRKLYARAAILDKHGENMPEPKTKKQDIYQALDDIAASKPHRHIDRNGADGLELGD